MSLAARLCCALALVVGIWPSASWADASPNLVRLEVGGPGLIYSANYERLLANEVAVRIGASFLPRGLFDDNASLTLFPLGASWFWGGPHHHLELGAGLTPIWVSDAVFQESGLELEAFAAIGYRYLPERTGLTFSATFTPIWFTRHAPTSRVTFERGLQAFGGVSVGWTF